MSVQLIHNQDFTTNQNLTVAAGDVLSISECTFRACKFQVTGDGDVVIRNVTGEHIQRGFASIIIAGSLNIDGFDAHAAQTPDTGSLWSCLTIRRTSGGTVQNVMIQGFLGNAILCESLNPSLGQITENLDFSVIRARFCGGGMWNLDTSLMTVDEFYTINCEYDPHPVHAPGLVGHANIIDELYAGGAYPRPVGDTVFTNVKSRVIGPTHVHWLAHSSRRFFGGSVND